MQKAVHVPLSRAKDRPRRQPTGQVWGSLRMSVRALRRRHTQPVRAHFWPRRKSVKPSSNVSMRFGESRRAFIGGSDARIIMGKDEAALKRLWQEKRGEIEPEDLSGDLIVQLGLVTEQLNRLWFERNTG